MRSYEEENVKKVLVTTTKCITLWYTLHVGVSNIKKYIRIYEKTI